MAARFTTELRLGLPGARRAFRIDLENVGDRTEHAVVAHEIPGRNGAILQHHGQNAQVLQLRAYWLGARYVEHFAFREALKTIGLAEFVHPELGLLQGMFRTSSFRYDERQETAEADLEFVEDASSSEPLARPDVVSSAEGSFAASLAEQIEAVRVAARAELGAEAAAIMSRELDPSQPALGQFSRLSAKARGYVRSLDQAVQHYEGVLQDVANPANSVIGTITYGLTLPDRIVGGLARTCERYSLALSALRSLPTHFMQNLQAALVQLIAAVPFTSAEAKRAAAARLGLEAAGIFGTDEDRRDAWRKAEGEQPFDAAGRFQAPASPLEPIMSSQEAEEILSMARLELQATFTEDRSQEALARLALDLLEHVRVVKMEYDRVIEIDVANETPLHLVLLRAGLPISYAERVLSLNPGIRRPNFVRGRIKVYAPRN